MINAQKHIKTNNCKTAVNSALANGQHHTELVAALRLGCFPLGDLYTKILINTIITIKHYVSFHTKNL